MVACFCSVLLLQTSEVSKSHNVSPACLLAAMAPPMRFFARLAALKLASGREAGGCVGFQHHEASAIAVKFFLNFEPTTKLVFDCAGVDPCALPRHNTRIRERHTLGPQRPHFPHTQEGAVQKAAYARKSQKKSKAELAMRRALALRGRAPAAQRTALVYGR